MITQNAFLLEELIRTGSDEILKKMRTEITRFQELDEVHPEDRDMARIIDAYFEAKPAIFDKIEDMLKPDLGHYERDFEYDIFDVHVEYHNLEVIKVEINWTYDE